MPKDPRLLEKTVGYYFRNRALLQTALTHSSYTNELRSKGVESRCNERLEFLGDSVLSVIVSRFLFQEFDSRQEGDLTKIRAAVVCEKALAKYAAKISLGEYLLLGHGEDKNDGRHRPSITADAFEALLGAFYLDSGYDCDKIEKFLLPFVKEEIADSGEDASFMDYKTALQQIVQQANGEKLRYVLVGESGPDHDKSFQVEARLNSNVIGHGTGNTKRAAEQNAAREALELFGSAQQK
ncbi:MAG: ribonuclease III [Clostridiales bacterium]|nr:ribonuclease III [Clostridiales bacterium]